MIIRYTLKNAQRNSSDKRSHPTDISVAENDKIETYGQRNESIVNNYFINITKNLSWSLSLTNGKRRCLRSNNTETNITKEMWWQPRDVFRDVLEKLLHEWVRWALHQVYRMSLWGSHLYLHQVYRTSVWGSHLYLKNNWMEIEYQHLWKGIKNCTVLKIFVWPYQKNERVYW